MTRVHPQTLHLRLHLGHGGIDSRRRRGGIRRVAGRHLAGLFCLGMMGSMLWMMVAKGTGHGHKSGDNAPDN